MLVTGITGGFLARTQGLAVLHRIRWQLGQGQLPAGSLLDGLLILSGGLLLVTPGVLTDAAGFALLSPPGRHLVKTWLQRWLERWIQTGTVFRWRRPRR